MERGGLKVILHALAIFVVAGLVGLGGYIGTREVLHAFDLRELRSTYGVAWGDNGWEVAEVGPHSHGAVLSSGVRSGRTYCNGYHSKTGPNVPIIETYRGKQYMIWPGWEHPYWRLAEIFDMPWCDGQLPHTHISQSFTAPLLKPRG